MAADRGVGGFLLAIDTCGPVCAVRLEDADGSCLGAREEPMERGHAERLLPLAAAVLQGAGIVPAEIEMVACATGPGSLTGVRIGVAAARGLALALGIRAVGVGTLATLMPEAADGGSMLAAVLDGPRDTVFAEAHGDDGVMILAPRRMEPAALAAILTSHGAPLLIAGAGAGHVLPFLAPIQARIVHTRATADLVRLAALARAGDGETPPRPLYLRAPDATPASMPRAVDA